MPVPYDEEKYDPCEDPIRYVNENFIDIRYVVGGDGCVVDILVLPCYGSPECRWVTADEAGVPKCVQEYLAEYMEDRCGCNR